MSVLRPKDLTTSLGISASTLRLWTEKFGPVLSPSATKATTETGTPAQRRFTEDDLTTLRQAKQLLGQNKTYEEVLEALQGDDELELPELTPSPPPDQQSTAPALPSSLDDHPIMVAFRETLEAKDQTIQTLQLALTHSEGELQTVQAAKDETIASLQAQIEELKNRQAVPSPASSPARFKWGFLNRLLLDTPTQGDES